MELTPKALLLLTSFFTGFGIVIPVLCFVRTKHLQKIAFKNLFMLTAIQAVRVAGILYVIFWAIDNYLDYLNTPAKNYYVFENRFFGPYAFATWLQPLWPLLLSQLLRIKKVRQVKWLLAVVSLLFLLSIERWVIIITSFYRDYLPSSWSMQQGNFLWHYLLSVVIFIFTTLTIILATGKLKTIVKQ